MKSFLLLAVFVCTNSTVLAQKFSVYCAGRVHVGGTVRHQDSGPGYGLSDPFSMIGITTSAVWVPTRDSTFGLSVESGVNFSRFRHGELTTLGFPYSSSYDLFSPSVKLHYLTIPVGIRIYYRKACFGAGLESNFLTTAKGYYYLIPATATSYRDILRVNGNLSEFVYSSWGGYYLDLGIRKCALGGNRTFIIMARYSRGNVLLFKSQNGHNLTANTRASSFTLGFVFGPRIARWPKRAS